MNKTLPDVRENIQALFKCTEQQADKVYRLVIDFYSTGLDWYELIRLLRSYSRLDEVGFDVYWLLELRKENEVTFEQS